MELGCPQADSRVRLLVRRFLMIARPARVFMRARKPCLRFRRRLLGWKVLLLTVPHHISRSSHPIAPATGRESSGLFAVSREYSGVAFRHLTRFFREREGVFHATLERPRAYCLGYISASEGGQRAKEFAGLPPGGSRWSATSGGRRGCPHLWISLLMAWRCGSLRNPCVLLHISLADSSSGRKLQANRAGPVWKRRDQGGVT